MATKTKRFLAITLALCLLTAQLITPAVAVEETQPTITVTTEVTEIPTDGGTRTETETTTTEITTSDTGITTITDTTEKEWKEETSEEQTFENAPADEEGYIPVSEETTTKVEGSETTKEIEVNEGPEYPLSESGSTQGSETTTVTTETVKEKTEKEEIPDTATDNDYVEGNTVEGEWSDPKENETAPGTSSDAKIDGQPDEVTLNMKQDDPNTSADESRDEVAESGSITTVVNTNELNVTPGTSSEDILDDKGNVIGTKKTVITPIKDDNGTVTGYQVTTTTTRIHETEKVEQTKEGTPETTTKTETNTTVSEPETIFTLPEKPAASESVDEATGNKTATTVEEITENGKVVGYKSTTIVTDAEGNELHRSSESIYGTTTVTGAETKTETTTETTVTGLTTDKTVTTETTVTTDTETKELVPVMVNGTWGWVYRADLEAVLSGEGHGDVDMEHLLVDLSKKPADGTTNTTTDLFGRPNAGNMPADADMEKILGDMDFVWFGEYGLESAIHAQADGGTGWHVKQFVLRDVNGDPVTVYCADFNTSPEENFRYDMENLEDADYYSDADAEHIRAIALNGFWGSTSGTGSLADFQAKLKKAGQAKTGLTDAQIDSITEGMALTATQTAIWRYGDSSTDTEYFTDTGDVVGMYRTGSKFSNYENDIVEKLYDYLIGLTAKATDSTTMITEKHFATEASITVGEKAEDVLANLDDSDDNDVYNTSVSFSLLVEPNQDKDDLVVTVLDGSGNPIRKVRLAGSSANDDSLFGTYTKNNNNYTISDLQIAEGVSITLNLAGMQYLDQGVYLYTSEVKDSKTSQTFVGLAEGEREVNLNVNLTFEVDDPQATIENSYTSSTQSKTDTRVDTKTDTRTETEVENHITVTTTVTSSTHREWDSSWEKEYTYEYDTDFHDDDFGFDDDDKNDEDDRDDHNGGGSYDNGDGTITILDGDVPLANVPKTGDVSAIWVILSMASAGGMIVLNKKREDEE